MKSILQYFDKKELILTQESILWVLDAGHQFQVPFIVKACSLFIASQLQEGSVLEILNLAHYYSDIALLQAVYQFICDNFLELQRKGFLFKMGKEQLQALLESDLYINANEFNIFSFCYCGVENNFEENSHYAKDIFPHVKYHLMSMADLSQIQQQADAWLNDVKEFSQLLQAAIRFKNEIHHQVLLQSWHTLPRGGKDTLCMFLRDMSLVRKHTYHGCRKYGATSQIELPLKCQLWNPNMPEFVQRTLQRRWERKMYAVAGWNHFLYVAGGFDYDTGNVGNAV